MPKIPGGEIVLYEAPDGEVRVDVRLDHETVWLTQQQMAELFGRERSVVTKHIRSAFREGELDPVATCAKFAQVRSEGSRTVSREVEHYNLDLIISVGYRVKSLRGTQFRIWATRTLREHLVRGYTINRQRFEHNARELEATLALVRRAAAGELSTDQGRGLVDVIARYTQTFLLPRCWATWSRAYSASRPIAPSRPRLLICSTSRSRITRSRTATSASARSCLSGSCTATGNCSATASR